MQTYVHPRSGMVIEGVRLPPNSVIRMDDEYDSSDGKWRLAGLAAGNILQYGCMTIWIRKPNPLSDNARILLGYLNMRPWGEQSCIGKRNYAFYVIPSPTFNWDGRLDIESQRVCHPECIQELVDCGYLTLSEYEVCNWMSSYSVASWYKNHVYVLTEDGKREGVRLLA